MPKNLLSLFLICIFLTCNVQAKKLFKYQDQEGIWHFTDTQPETDLSVEVRQMKVAKKKMVWLEQEGNKRQPEYFIRNGFHGPIEVEIAFHNQKNIKAKPTLPGRFVVQPGKSGKLFGISAENMFESWGYGLKYSYVIGDPGSEHEREHLYLPPIEPGSVFQVTQGFGGKFSHQDEQNRFAIDIAMPVGTPIYAARSGVVMKVDNDFYKGGVDNKAYLSRANSVRIVHNDGSMAVYAHLKLEQAKVHAGQRVYAGQLIAYSGNTGFTSGPHLHFAVQVNKGMQLVSVPFKFSEDDSGTGPTIGSWLTSLSRDNAMQGAGSLKQD
jgi:murein DD-endopeptidase MepM/ murein hydrolase activator NlpD